MDLLSKEFLNGVQDSLVLSGYQWAHSESELRSNKFLCLHFVSLIFRFIVIFVDLVDILGWQCLCVQGLSELDQKYCRSLYLQDQFEQSSREGGCSQVSALRGKTGCTGFTLRSSFLSRNIIRCSFHLSFRSAYSHPPPLQVTSRSFQLEGWSVDDNSMKLGSYT